MSSNGVGEALGIGEMVLTLHQPNSKTCDRSKTQTGEPPNWAQILSTCEFSFHRSPASFDGSSQETVCRDHRV